MSRGYFLVLPLATWHHFLGRHTCIRKEKPHLSFKEIHRIEIKAIGYVSFILKQSSDPEGVDLITNTR